MANAVPQVNKATSGLCPHGLPPSACPICSNIGGGSMRVGERPQKAGEMSYHQCAMIGAMMIARALRLENHEKYLQQRAEFILQFQNNLEKMIYNLNEFVNKFSNNFFFKPVSYTIANIVVPVLNFIRNIPNIISNFQERLFQLKQKIIDIQDKLNAIFGEVKLFIQKKIGEIVAGIKNKFERLFRVFQRDNTSDHDTKIDEDKKLFNLRTMIGKFLNRKKKDDSENKSRF